MSWPKYREHQDPELNLLTRRQDMIPVHLLRQWDPCNQVHTFQYHSPGNTRQVFGAPTTTGD